MLGAVALAQVAVERLGAPGYGGFRQARERGRLPAIDQRAREKCRTAHLRPERIARRVAGAAVAHALHQVGAAVPFGRASGVGLPGRGVVEQRVPAGHERAHAERKGQLRGGQLGAHGRLGHEPGIERGQVVVVHLRERGVGEGRVQVLAVARDAFAHGALEGAEGPLAQAGLCIGREVGRVHGAEGRVHGAPARIGRAAGGRVADHAVTRRRYQAPALDGGGVVDRCAGCLCHRGDGRAPAQQRRAHGQAAGGQGQRARPGAALAWPGGAGRNGRGRQLQRGQYIGLFYRRPGGGACALPWRTSQRIEPGTHHLGREGRRAKAHARGVEDGVGNGRRAGHGRGLARAHGRLVLPGHVHDLDDRHLAKAQDGVAAPFARVHGLCDRVEAHLLLERAAGGLHHVAMHLVLDTGRVDHEAGVVPHDHAAHMHLAGLLVDLDIGHPGGPGGAEAGPLAVDVARIGKALALHPVAFGALQFAGAGHTRSGVREPAGLIRRGLHEFGRARVAQELQAERHRVHSGGGGQLVHIGFVREGVGQGRHAAQPRGAHDGRHVVDGHAQVLVVVGRARRAVAHLVGLGHGLDAAREQQGQRGCAVRRVRGLEIVGRHRAICVEPAAHLHELGRALGLPQVLLLARELHAHGRAHGTREQRGVGRDVVGAVAAVAARGLHADEVDVHVGHAHQARQVGAQHMGVLRAGPDHHARAATPATVFIVSTPLGHGARGADGAMQLVGPDIGARHGLLGTGQRGVHIALVHQAALGGGVCADGLGHGLGAVLAGKTGPGLPAHGQAALGLFGLFLALGDDAHEVADHHHSADARDMGDGGLVHRFERVADEVAMVGPGIGRAHHAAVQHAGHAHVVHENQLAADLGRYVHARHGLPDHGVVGCGLGGRGLGQLQRGVRAGQQFAIGELACRLGRHLHQAGPYLQRIGGHAQAHGSLGHQPVARLGRCRAQRLGVDLDRGAGNGGALVGRARGVAQHHVHPGQRHVELFGHDLRQRRADARAQVHMAVERGHAAVVPDGQQDLHALGRIAHHQGGLALGGRRRGRRLAHDQQHAVGAMEVGARERAVGAQRRAGRCGLAHAGTPRSSTAARCTARMISTCVPQRHRLPESSRRMAASSGSGLRSSRATAIITMPLRQ